jgi:tRNA (guanine-N7-)-methyltransferase
MEPETDYGVPIPGRVLPAEQWARTAIKRLPAEGPLDWEAIFGRSAPLVLDLGCGNGRFILSSALRRPELNHLGLDVLPLVIRYATKRANQRGLHHVRLAVCGAHEFLEQYVPPRSVAEIHLYHPQPYRDETKSFKRLVTPQFLLLVRQALVADGSLTLQTDNTGYWDYLREVAPRLFEFTSVDGPWPDAPRGRTRREIYARQHRLTVYRAVCRVRADLSQDQATRIAGQLPLPRFAAQRKPSSQRRR